MEMKPVKSRRDVPINQQFSESPDLLQDNCDFLYGCFTITKYPSVLGLCFTMYSSRTRKKANGCYQVSVKKACKGIRFAVLDIVSDFGKYNA